VKYTSKNCEFVGTQSLERLHICIIRKFIEMPYSW